MGRPKTKQGVLSIDPFDVSTRPTEGQMQWAKWFKEITQAIPGETYHIRRVHYQTLGKLKPDGKPYENTANDSALMARASEYARYLGLVDFDKIEDHKNEGEVVHAVYEPDEVRIDFSVRSKSFTTSKIYGVEDMIPLDSPDCIEYGVSIRQPYHLEIWVEKSTANDVLIPIAEKYGATLMVAGGHFSITNVKDLYARIEGLNKPIRVFYIRDFDPAGETMAKAVGRKIEWFVRDRNPEIDLKLFDVTLTHEQCVKYQLPRSPMDRKDRYKGNFEEKYGAGATELDALEALHPGALTNIVTEAISPYFDETLAEEIADFEDSENERYEQYKQDIVAGVIGAKRAELEPLVEQYNKLTGKINKVGTQIEELINSTDVCYDFELEYPESSSQTVDEEADPLLDTQLSYEEQLKKYRNGSQSL